MCSAAARPARRAPSMYLLNIHRDRLSTVCTKYEQSMHKVWKEYASSNNRVCTKNMHSEYSKNV